MCVCVCVCLSVNFISARTIFSKHIYIYIYIYWFACIWLKTGGGTARCSNFRNIGAQILEIGAREAFLLKKTSWKSNRDPAGHQFCHHFWPTGIESGSSRDPVGHQFSNFWHHFLTCREAAKITQKRAKTLQKLCFYEFVCLPWCPSRLDPD